MSEPVSVSEFSRFLSSTATSIVDKAWEISWATRIVFIVLFLDIFLLTTSEVGLLLWAQGSKPNVNLAGALLFAGSLCFIAAYILPVVIFTIQAISFRPLLFISNTISEHPDFATKPSEHRDYVPSYHILSRAIENENKFFA